VSFIRKTLFFAPRLSTSHTRAKTTAPFSKFSKTAQFLSIFAKNGPLFAKNAPKNAKTSPKTVHFGTPSLSRRHFKPKNADHTFSQSPKTFISPYKNNKNPAPFTLV